MRSFIPMLALVPLLWLAPLGAQAASASFFGPIVPAVCNCTSATGISTAPAYGCVLVVLQNVINFGISLGVLAATLAIAYAGFIFMMNSGNPEARGKARGMLINVAIGLVILLSAWLVVDFIMKTLYSGDNGSKDFGPWNSILASPKADMCILATKPTKIPGTLGAGLTAEMAGSGNQLAPAPLSASLGTTFTYDPGIQAQIKNASPKLQGLLSCMAGKLPKGVGRISSISDNSIASGARTFAQCSAGGCSHGANSCHYGGRTCVGQSYAVDFGDGDPQNPSKLAALKSAASACGADYLTANEDGKQTHLHVSVGASCGCN
ncbi:MAG: hypothetical protein JWL82_148 [Parcubacteria group bacterium]|nr:hypothetical protein [Parcubacteria group bacterium]